MNCEKQQHNCTFFVCPAWSTLMFLVLVCLFVMMSPYRTAFSKKTCTHTSSSSIPDAYTCKYSLKNVIHYCPDILRERRHA